MTILKIANPFGAAVYYEESVTSTMDVSRSLAAAGEAHGTVITADYQEAGRGRSRGRAWQTEKKESLLLTILLRYPRIEDIPAALTLRAGLAAARAVEDFAPSLKNSLLIKWPNDVLIGAKKIAGILCEADGGNVHIGIGINVAQKDFPPEISQKAASIALAAGEEYAPQDRFLLLEKLLSRLHEEFETAAGQDWKTRIEGRLYKNGEQVVFMEGAAGSKKEIKGLLSGIGSNGELLITVCGETQPLSFITGELVYSHQLK